MPRLVLVGVGLAWAVSGGEARAACPSGTAIDCTTNLSDTLMDGTSNLDVYACGSPYANLSQRGPEKVYSFSCPAAGNLRVELLAANCDVDLYALGGMCDPGTADCLSGSTFEPPNPEGVNVTCEVGMVITFVVEAYGFSPGGDCPRNPGAQYTVRVDSGSPVCIATSCAGCVDSTVTPALCMPGDTLNACGAGSASCVNCDDGDPCTNDVCAAGACTNTFLCVGCSGDGDCAGNGGYCTAGGTCAAQEPMGTTCDRDAMCASGHCVDTVCCASACGGACEVCSAEGICTDEPSCVGSDGGVPDAGPGDDAAKEADAGAGSGDEKGCGCRVAPAAGARGVFLAALLLGIASMARRRRR